MKFEEFKKALAKAEPHRPEDLPDISLIKLLANPELYNLQVVRAQGFLELAFQLSHFKFAKARHSSSGPTSRTNRTGR